MRIGDDTQGGTAIRHEELAKDSELLTASTARTEDFRLKRRCCSPMTSFSLYMIRNHPSNQCRGSSEAVLGTCDLLTGLWDR